MEIFTRLFQASENMMHEVEDFLLRAKAEPIDFFVVGHGETEKCGLLIYKAEIEQGIH